ncbi:MAG: hypothetical protein JSW55_02640 [Chloroflexota bacterium]|nr:MAG: hypothetical protein JSW55_02640 [Chloroflexota bacterium]
MTKVQSTVNLVLKAVTIGMAVSSLVMLILGVVPLETVVMLLSIGLSALAVASFSETESGAAEIE